VDKLRTSEWLVARVTSTERAEEIIGDLAEQNLTVAHYWVAVLRICLAFTWRWIVGVPAAMLSFLMLGVPYFQILKPQVELAVSHGHDLEHDRIIKLSLYLFLSSVALASIMVLSLTRYGRRSVVTRLAAVLTFTVFGSALPSAPIRPSPVLRYSLPLHCYPSLRVGAIADLHVLSS